jgi:lysozyme family protein
MPEPPTTPPPPPRDADLAAQERELRRQEFAARSAEAKAKLAAASKSWWRNADPLLLAVIAGIFTLAGNTYVAYFNANATREQEAKKAANALAEEKVKAADELGLEREKAKATLILQAVSTNDPDAARRNMLFFLDGGLIEDRDGKIRSALDKYAPVLPSQSGQASLPLPTSPDAYESYFWSANIRPQRIEIVDAVVKRLIDARPRLEHVAQATNSPWYVIAAFWMEETGGSFNTHLHNGDRLTGKTIHVPAGRPLDWPPPAGVDPWEYSALDALHFYKLDDLNGLPIGEILARLERANGMGYQKRGLFSPFLWAGTDLYEKGKFVADAVFNSEVVDQQIGVATMLRRLQDQKLIDVRAAATAAASSSQGTKP